MGIDVTRLRASERVLHYRFCNAEISIGICTPINPLFLSWPGIAGSLIIVSTSMASAHNKSNRGAIDSIIAWYLIDVLRYHCNVIVASESCKDSSEIKRNSMEKSARYPRISSMSQMDLTIP